MIAILCVALIARPAPGSDPSRLIESQAKQMVTPDAQRAIDAGLISLAKRQNADGSFGSGSIYKRNVAVTALCGMAFLSAGHSPGRGKYAGNVEKATDFLIASAEPNGYIIHKESASHGPMYGHGFATLFLAEVYGTAPRKEIRETLKNAVNLIVNSQNKEGGWRYEPDGRDADVSVTVCQMMALRAARNCGIAVPKTTVDHCVEYIRRCQNPDGGFRYRLLENQPHSTFPRSAAAVVTLYSAGVYEGRDIDRGLQYLQNYMPRGDRFQYDNNYFYGHYYAVQAMWHAGGQHWDRWYPAIREELIKKQDKDGSWPDSLICSEYGTAMALLILQMPNNYLPIFQR